MKNKTFEEGIKGDDACTGLAPWDRHVVRDEVVVTTLEAGLSLGPENRLGRDRCKETRVLCWDQKVVLHSLGACSDRKIVFGDLEISSKYFGFRNGTLLM